MRQYLYDGNNINEMLPRHYSRSCYLPCELLGGIRVAIRHRMSIDYCLLTLVIWGNVGPS